MSDKNGALQIFSGKKLSPELSKQPLFATVKKIYIVFVTSEQIRYVFTADNKTFICFRYALNSLLRIK